MFARHIFVVGNLFGKFVNLVAEHVRGRTQSVHSLFVLFGICLTAAYFPVYFVKAFGGIRYVFLRRSKLGFNRTRLFGEQFGFTRPVFYTDFVTAESFVQVLQLGVGGGNFVPALLILV